MIYLSTGNATRTAPISRRPSRTIPTAPKCFHLAQAYLQIKRKDKARRVLEAGKARGLPPRPASPGSGGHSTRGRQAGANSG